MTVTIALLTVFFMFITGLKYASIGRTTRTKLVMTSFFFFIVCTLTISFWEYALDSLPYSIPAALLGAAVGYFSGVRAAEERLKKEGVTYYMEHFAHVHFGEGRLSWWALINFYTIMGALALINLVGLSNVIFGHARGWALFTSAIGAFFIGTIAPYLIHIWTIGARQSSSSTTSE